MGTKSNPGKYDCYAKAESDEPMFILLARDPHAPVLVRFWADWQAADGKSPEKIKEALDCANAMQKWRVEHEKKTET